MLILSLQNNIACARSFEASFIQKLYLSLALVTLKIRARKKFFMRARKKSTRTKIYLLVTKETTVKKNGLDIKYGFDFQLHKKHKLRLAFYQVNDLMEGVYSNLNWACKIVRDFS